MEMKNLTASLVCLAAFSAAAADLYVDCHGNAQYETIQEAVDAANAGDTVYVRPGTYDRGGRVDAAGGTNRVCIAKPLTLRATSDNPADTVIVGALDASETLGRGAAAVRCVLVCAGAEDAVVVRGFTIRDGASHLSGGAESDVRTHAGGASVESGNAWFADCRFSGNRGARGGQVRGGTYLRCRFSDGYGAEAAASARLVHCLLTAAPTSDSGGPLYLIASDVTCVNCTFYSNGVTYLALSLDDAHVFANCILAGQSYLTYSAGKIKAANSLFCCKPNAAESILNMDEAHLDATDCVTGRANEQFMAPAFEDWRPVSGSAAVGLGVAEALSGFVPPEGLDVYEDYAHGAVPRTGAIQAGCVQSVAAPAGGCVRVVGDFPFVIDGRTVHEDLYFWPTAYPTQCMATIAHSSDVGIYRVRCAADATSWIRYPMPNDTFLFVPPPEPSLTLTCTVDRASSVVNVDPSADAAVADGSEERPYRTIQAAVDASSTMGLVRAAAGDYREGGAVAGGVSNRVAIAKALRIVGAGAERSFIWGSRDPSAETANGCGTNAVRCVYAGEHNVCIQGFTLIDGHAGFSSAEESPAHNMPMDHGGAAKAASSCVIADCVITNCVAYRGSAGYGPHLLRCRVTCCGGFGSRLIEQARMTSCAVYGCLGPDGVKGEALVTLLDSCLARQSTLVAADAGQRVAGSAHEAVGCVIDGGASPTASWNWTVRGCFTAPGYYPAADKDGNVPDAATGDVRFVDAQSGDYRLMATSDAIGCGHYDGATFYQTYEPGLDGTPLLFVDGKPLPGAFQRPVPVLIAPSSIDAGTLSLCGTNAVEEGETVVVELTGAHRPMEGFLVDGEVCPGTRWTYVAPSFGALGGISVADVPKVVFGTNWYVNAAMPDDSGDGFTPETAKRTLISVCTNAYLLAGDVIHAARGDYAEGAALHSSAQAIRARAIVRSGVALVADEGPDVTFITGSPASAQCREGELGCGSDAVRCAVGEANGVLQGFTLRNGHTRWLMNDAGTAAQHVNDNYAGGFMGLSPSARIVNCTITGCVAPRSAMAHGGRFERCRLLGDTDKVDTGFDGNYIERFGGFYDSVILVSSFFSIQSPLVNCTLRNTSSASMVGYGQIYATDKMLQGITNCVFACQIRNMGTAEGFSPPNIGNVVCTGIAGVAPTAENAARFKIVPIERIAQAYGLEDLAFTGAKVEELVDCGVNVEGSAVAMDIEGKQRIFNRTVDLGAAEYDWRTEFAKTLARRNVDVAKATPNVTTNAVGGLELADGDSIEVNWMFKSNGRATFEVAADEGEVAVCVDGVEALPEGATYSILGNQGIHSVSIAYSGMGKAIVSAFVPPQVGFSIIIR